MRFEHFEHQGMDVHVLPTTKFKTSTLVLNFQRPLVPGIVTRTALIPHLLERGSERYPSVRDLQRQLDSMYGSYLSADAYKLGERHLLQLRVEIPNGKYLPGGPKLLGQAIAFLHEVALRPLREGGHFKPAFVELEKEALRKRIEGLINNKIHYAMVRAIEEMCHREPYRLYAGGRIEDLADLTPAILTAEYEEMLATAPMDLFVVGNVEPEVVRNELARAFPLPARAPRPLAPTALLSEVSDVRRVEDREEVTQGQLVLGLRTPVSYASDDHYTMMMYNGILGGFAHSKLFVNVRERESLAYSAHSRYEAQKGLVLIQAGINVSDHARALAVIHEQLDAMRQGQITDQELDQTRAMLINTYREAYDSPGALIKLAFEARIAGRERSIEELTRAIPRITREDVVRVAEQVRLDTEYFLRDRAAANPPQQEVAPHA